jgi:site-specific DNA recombinase
MSTNLPGDLRAALYARVSTDDQRDKQTIDNQVNALRGYAPHSGFNFVDEYLDDGISGTVPLEKRPEGRRMAQDARDGKFDVIVFYKLDRLARSLRNFLDIVDFSEEVGVGLRCMTEPFDTTNPVGRFAVQMMAAVAELERGTIIERTSLGRARIAAQGRWTGGIVPYGYLLDHEGFLTPDWTPRHDSPFSEAEIVQRIYRSLVEEKLSATQIAKQFNSEGIPMYRKYHGKGKPEATYKSKPGAIWEPTNVTRIIRASTYKGIHVWKAQGREIEREVPRLVESDAWDRAQDQLTSNKRLSKRPDHRDYLLRGLITCRCGKSYVGAHVSQGQGHYYYRCSSQLGDKLGTTACNGKFLRADWIETQIWEDVQGFIINPGDVIDQLQQRVSEELVSVDTSEARKQELVRAIDRKEAEKDRVLDAYRRGLIEIDALGEQIEMSRLELEPLQEEMAGIINLEAHKGKMVGELTNAESLLKALQVEIGGELDFQTRRTVVEALVKAVTVYTIGTGRKKQAEVDVTYTFDLNNNVVDQATIGYGSLPGSPLPSGKAPGRRQKPEEIPSTNGTLLERWAERRWGNMVALIPSDRQRNSRTTPCLLAGSPGS